MKDFRYFALLACVLTLPACETMDGFTKDLQSLNFPSMSMTESGPENLIYEGKCPRVEVVDDLRTATDFADAGNMSATNLVSKADIARVESACAYDENTVTVDLSLTFAGTLGPQADTTGSKKTFMTYPFFVAVTSPSGDILAKEVFSANLTYDPGQTAQTYFDKMRQVIPVESQNRGSRHKILVGFQLSPDQLAYNRENAKKTALIEDKTQQPPTLFETQAQDAMNQAEQQNVNRGNPIDITGQ